MSRTKQSDLLKRAALTPQEIEMIVACLLGDGTLSKSGKNYRLRIEHNSKHREYVEWKYNWLKRLCISPIQVVSVHSSVRFGTIGHPEITKLRETWYLKTKQIVSDLKLTPMMIAVWFMDDGSNNGNNLTLNTHSFSIEDQNTIIDFLKEKYSINPKLVKDRHKWKISIGNYDYEKFISITTPYVPKSMIYKIVYPRIDLSTNVGRALDLNQG